MPELPTGANALAQRYASHDPAGVAAALERVDAAQASDWLSTLDARAGAAVLSAMLPAVGGACLASLPAPLMREVLGHIDRPIAATILGQLDGPTRQEVLARAAPRTRSEIERLLAYPPHSAGALMDTQFLSFRADSRPADVITRLRELRHRKAHTVYVMAADGHLAGALPLQDILLAEDGVTLATLIERPPVSVGEMAPRETVVATFTNQNLTSLPVVDAQNRMVGVLRQAAIMQAVQSDALSSMQSMVGVGKDEHALSSPLVSVRRRLPWLNINLLTAFLAAAVVGAFENTIAQFTALAVLLPVVAGQSGNTGAQALAVTMRGLALREVRSSDWMRLVWKEAIAGALNGIAIAAVTAVGVLIWSRSPGLCAVIGVAMVMAMTLAGISGAIIPIVLAKMNQDPAQSSSIVLTTVTDVTGFLSFLGLATVFSRFL